jgi:hypothetical protein
MDLERFPLPDVPLSTSYCQIFLMGIGRNATTQDQSQERHGDVLDWFRLSQRVIALHPISLYYVMEKLVALDELRVATYIDWRTAL